MAICQAQEWQRDGRGLWAMRNCISHEGHQSPHTFEPWSYAVGPCSGLFEMLVRHAIAERIAQCCNYDRSNDADQAYAYAVHIALSGDDSPESVEYRRTIQSGERPKPEGN